MNTEIIKSCNVNLKVDSIRKKFKIRKDSIIDKTLCQKVNEIQKFAAPKGMYALLYVNEVGENYIASKNIVLTSKVLRENLENKKSFYPYIATIGTELENWYSSQKSLSDKYLGNIILQEICYDMKENIVKIIKEKYKTETLSTMNPGSLKDWDITERDKLFKAFEGKEKDIGIEILDQNLIKPFISVYGIIFENKTGYNNCKLCPKKKCINRSADYEKGSKR